MSSYYVRVPHDGIALDDLTKGAVQFHVEDRKEWIPRSQLEDYDEEMMEIPTWLAEARDLAWEEIPTVGNVVWKR